MDGLMEDQTAPAAATLSDDVSAFGCRKSNKTTLISLSFTKGDEEGQSTLSDRLEL